MTSAFFFIAVAISAAQPSISSDTPKIAPYTLHRGKIGSALYDIAQPKSPRGNLLVFCHGLYSHSQPLDTELRPAREPFRTALLQGWTVAASSYPEKWVFFVDAEGYIIIRQHMANAAKTADARRHAQVLVTNR